MTRNLTAQGSAHSASRSGHHHHHHHSSQLNQPWSTTAPNTISGSGYAPHAGPALGMGSSILSAFPSALRNNSNSKKMDDSTSSSSTSVNGGGTMRVREKREGLRPKEPGGGSSLQEGCDFVGNDGLDLCDP